MEKEVNTYKKGDWIVHPIHGIGQVAGKVKKALGGEPQLFYTVEIEGGQYWLAADKSSSSHARPLVNQDQINEAIGELKKSAVPFDETSLFEKKKQYLADESFLATALLIRDFSGKRQDTRLKTDEAAWLRKIKKQFVKEWAMASGEDAGILERKLKAVLKISSEKSQ